MTFNSTDNYILKFSSNNSESILGGSTGDTISLNEKSGTYYSVQIYGQGGDDSIVAKDDTITSNSKISIFGGDDNDTITASGITFSGTGVVSLSGGGEQGPWVVRILKTKQQLPGSNF